MPLHRAELPPLELLRSFEAAARTLSFNRAAGELFLTQSAVSRQIAALEARLGVALFERRHRALALTDAGQTPYRTTMEVLDRLRDAVHRLRPAGGRRGLTVTTTVGFVPLWLVPRLPRFTAAHPEVDVRIAAANRMTDIEREDIDVAVRFTPCDRGQGEPLFGEEVQPVCAPALARDPARPLREPVDRARLDPTAQAFVAWLREEAAADAAAGRPLRDAPPAPESRSRPTRSTPPARRAAR